MNDSSQLSNSAADSLDKLALAEIAKALTLSQLISILSLALAILGGAFTLGMYAQKLENNNETNLTEGSAEAMVRLESQLERRDVQIHKLRQSQTIERNKIQGLETELKKSRTESVELGSELKSKTENLNIAKDKLATAGVQLQEKSDVAISLMKDKRNLQAKEQFLALNSLTFFNAILCGENIFESTASTAAGEAKSQLEEFKASYIQLVKELVDRDDIEVRFSQLDRSGRKLMLVFEHDDSHWLMPDFVKP